VEDAIDPSGRVIMAAIEGMVGLTFTKVVNVLDGARVDLVDSASNALLCNWINVLPTQDNSNDNFTVEVSGLATNEALNNAPTDTNVTSSGIMGLTGRMSATTDGVTLRLGHDQAVDHIGIWHTGGSSKWFIVNYGGEAFEGKKLLKWTRTSRAQR